jgi:chromosome segregation ATPase
MTKTLDQYTSPTRKVIAMLHAGRDKLREKYAVVRENLRTAENQVRAVEKSREMWRQRAEAAEAALAAAQKNMTDHSSASPAVV